MLPPPGPWFGSLKPLIQAGDYTGLPEQLLVGPVIGSGHFQWCLGDSALLEGCMEPIDSSRKVWYLIWVRWRGGLLLTSIYSFTGFIYLTNICRAFAVYQSCFRVLLDNFREQTRSLPPWSSHSRRRDIQ